MRVNAEKEKWLAEQVAIQETATMPRSIGLTVSGDDIFTWPEGVAFVKGSLWPPSLMPGENIFILEPHSITPRWPDDSWRVEWRIYGPIAEASCAKTSRQDRPSQEWKASTISTLHPYPLRN